MTHLVYGASREVQKVARLQYDIEDRFSNFILGKVAWERGGQGKWALLHNHLLSFTFHTVTYSLRILVILPNHFCKTNITTKYPSDQTIPHLSVTYALHNAYWVTKIGSVATKQGTYDSTTLTWVRTTTSASSPPAAEQTPQYRHSEGQTPGSVPEWGNWRNKAVAQP